jgi:uncharacterized membrane protein
MDRSPASRAMIGFFAAGMAVLIFHQGLAGLLYKLDLRGLEMSQPAYDMTPRLPLGTPAVVLHCLQIGMLGLVFGLISPGLSRPLWTPGLVFGLFYGLITLFVVPQLQVWGPLGVSAPIPSDWAPQLLLDAVWGFGMGVIYSLMAPKLPGDY